MWPGGLSAPIIVQSRHNPQIFSCDIVFLEIRVYLWHHYSRPSGRVSSLGFRVQGSGFGVWGLGFRVQGSGFGVWGSGF